MSTIKIEYKDQYAVVQLDNGKVNAISTQLSKDLKEAFLALEVDKKVKGVILTGRPHGFSAGLDVVELATSNEDESRAFWFEYHGALQALVNFSKPFVCAITGYAPAGATIYTLCADYRVMGKGAKHVVGMHEFKMSMQIPRMLCEIYEYYLGSHGAWIAVQTMKLYNSDEALAAGLVEESVEVEEVMGRAEKHLKKLMGVHPAVFKESKRIFRKGLVEIVNRDHAVYVEEGLVFNSNPELQEMTKRFLASLKK